jgi:hypothetical protein
MNNSKLLFSAILIIISIGVFSQSKVSKRIMEIGRTDNRTMQHLDILVNRIGGRPIGSNAYENATYWVASQLKKCGLEVEIQEVGELPVGFNRGPWFGRMNSDESLILDFVTPAYTSGTKGLQRGHVLIEPKTSQEFERMKGKLKGAWVLVSGDSKGFAIDNSLRADSLRAEIIAYNDTVKDVTKRKSETALFYKQMCRAGVLFCTISTNTTCITL